MQDKRIGRYVLPAVMVLSVVLVVVFIAQLLQQDRQSDANFEDVSQAVVQTLDLSQMQQADNQMIKRLYGLSPADFDGLLLYYPTTNMGAEELLIVKLRDISQQQSVQQAVEARLQTQKNSFEGYGVEQFHLLENSVLEVQGNYILFVVHADAAAAQQAFLNAL